MRRQRFRFDTIDVKLVFRSDVVLLALQFIVSIIYIGSWASFLLIRMSRVIWGLITSNCRLKIYRSRMGICLMKADWIFRFVTFVLDIILAIGFSVSLPEQFCELIGKEQEDFASCKWQVFGMRIVFILLAVPLDLLTFAVIYRHATDMIFKIQLRRVTGQGDIELENRGKKTKSSIAFLMDPDVDLNRRNVLAQTSSFATAVVSVTDGSERRPMSSDGRPSSVNMSQRPMLDHQNSGLVDDFTGAMLPSITPTSRRVNMDQFDFGEGSDNDSEGDVAIDDTDGEEGGNE